MTKSIKLTQWQRLALEQALRKLEAYGEIDPSGLRDLHDIIERSTSIRVTYDPS